MQNMANYIGKHVAIVAKDETEKERVKKYQDALGQLMNHVKAFAQRLQEMMQKQQQGNGQGMDPKDSAKIQGMMMQAKTKSDIARTSAAQRTAQRQIQFEQKMAQDQQKHGLELHKGMVEHRANLTKTALEAQESLRQSRMKAFDENDTTPSQAQPKRYRITRRKRA